ncbi:hypothetical protein K9N68_37470 (plasmid) [Kovacikia minuta CCNUW1]|uniref:hypothetical protein n=1 Tax=Kovacikia minuta TaxID=2931930 RepID=UPI001CCD9613|nr:hypothetical protein [Kovacikia minuta]UBF29904.1 hypothetical protein K9N68_37470 [Kovacikia minuta CCNUW1]
MAGDPGIGSGVSEGLFPSSVDLKIDFNVVVIPSTDSPSSSPISIHTLIENQKKLIEQTQEKLLNGGDCDDGCYLGNLISQLNILIQIRLQLTA